MEVVIALVIVGGLILVIRSLVASDSTVSSQSGPPTTAPQPNSNASVMDGDTVRPEYRNSAVMLNKVATHVATQTEKNMLNLITEQYHAIPYVDLNALRIALHLTGGDQAAAKALLVRDYLDQFVATGKVITSLNERNYPNFTEKEVVEKYTIPSMDRHLGKIK